MHQNVSKKEVVQRMSLANIKVSPAQLTAILEFLSSQAAPDQALDRLIQKALELTTLRGSYFNDKILAECIMSFDQSMNMLEIIQAKYRKAVVVVTPYELGSTTFYENESTNPSARFFKFPAVAKTRYARQRLKSMRAWAIPPGLSINSHCYGILISEFRIEERMKVYSLQNEAGQVVPLDLSNYSVPAEGTFLIEQAVYVAIGNYIGADLVFRVKDMLLPRPQPPPQKDRATVKFFTIVQQLLELKDSDQQAIWPRLNARNDIYLLNSNQNPKVLQVALIFGNVTLDEQTVAKIRSIIQRLHTLQYSICCIVLLLSPEKQPIKDLNLLFPSAEGSQGCRVFIIPHLTSLGPQLLPRIPITKEEFEGKNVSVLTNPAKITIQGRSSVFTNYSVFKTLNNQTLMPNPKLEDSQRLQLVGKFLYSQNNVGLYCAETFWEQQEFMEICSDDFLFLNDPLLRTGTTKLAEGGNVTCVGNFNRDGDFVMFVPSTKNPVNPGNFGRMNL